jgi:hypothetical protein
MKDDPLHVRAPVDEDPAALSSLILPWAAAGPLRVTLIHTGDPKVLEEGMKVFRRAGRHPDRRQWVARSGDCPAREVEPKRFDRHAEARTAGAFAGI